MLSTANPPATEKGRMPNPRLVYDMHTLGATWKEKLCSTTSCDVRPEHAQLDDATETIMLLLDAEQVALKF